MTGTISKILIRRRSGKAGGAGSAAGNGDEGTSSTAGGETGVVITGDQDTSIPSQRLFSGEETQIFLTG
jgi:hypothetical protein